MNDTTGLTLLPKPAPLLDEAHERRNPRARPDHEDRSARLEGEAELGLPDVHGHSGLVPVFVGLLVLQPVGGHTLVQPPRLGLVLHHHSTDVDGVWIHLQEGRAGRETVPLGQTKDWMGPQGWG